MPLTEAEGSRLQDMINGAVQSMINGAAQRVHDDLTGTMTRVKAYEAEIVGLRNYIQATACALSGQLPALPDGTKITSINAAHTQELSAIAQLKAQIAASTGHGVNPVADGADGGQPVA